MKTANKISCALFCTALMASPFTRAADLTIDVKGMTSDKGVVLIALYDKTDAWMKKAVKFASVAAKPDSVSVVLKDLPEGEYAASIFHDENGNGKLDTNAIGMPIEPYSFSNDAAGTFGPPTFEQSKFKLDGEKKSITVNFK
jgi:uncharacterized protein (DUF2141 family)